MALLSARDRYIEIALLAVWATLLVWALVDRLGSGLPQSWENGTLVLLTSMVLGSASRFVQVNRARWSLLAVAMVLVVVALIMIVP